MIIKPYSGTDDYIFISYAHKDSELVYPIIEQMQKDGYNVWFDEGIDPGTEWPKFVADRLYHCAFFIALISENYLASTNCIDELDFARNKEKPRVILYLQDISLPIDVELRHGRIQAIFWFKYTETAEAFKKLYSAKGIAGSRAKDDINYIESDFYLKKARQSSELSDGRDSVSYAAYLPSTSDETFLFRYDEELDGLSIVSLLDKDKTYAEIIIPEEFQGKPVKAIDLGAFRDCERLTSVSIPSSVYSIKYHAFFGCKNLTSITIAYGVYKIERLAFARCRSLTSVIIPESVKVIDDCAFEGCSSLTNITIPPEIYVFGDQVFYDCNKLEKIIWPQYSGKVMQMRVEEFYQRLGRCRHCGGYFKKGFFSTKCTHCGRKKDY